MVSGPKVYFLLDIATYFGVTGSFKLPFTLTRYTHNINMVSEIICVSGKYKHYPWQIPSPKSSPSPQS